VLRFYQHEIDEDILFGFQSLDQMAEIEQIQLLVELLELVLNQSKVIDMGRNAFMVTQFVISKALTNDNHFRYPHELTAMCAHLQFAMRCLCLHSIMSLDLKDPDTLFEIRNQYLSYIHANCESNGPNAFFAVHSTLNLLIKARDDIAPMADAAWVVDPVSRQLNYNELIYDGVLVKFNNLSNGYHAVFDRINVLLNDILPIDLQLPNFNTIHDLISNQTEGYCFLEDKRNASLGVIQNQGIEHFQQYLCPNQTWNNERVQTFRIKANQLNVFFLFAIHMSSGQPPRGSEYKPMKLRNSNGIPRSVYILYNTICLRQYYKKQTSMTGQYANVSRFLPNELAYLFLKYLVAIRPIQQ